MSEAANSFVLHAGTALHQHGFCGQVHASHSDGILRLYAGKDESGFVGVIMLAEQAEALFAAGDLPQRAERLASYANDDWENGVRDKVFGPAAEAVVGPEVTP